MFISAIQGNILQTQYPRENFSKFDINHVNTIFKGNSQKSCSVD